MPKWHWVQRGRIWRRVISFIKCHIFLFPWPPKRAIVFSLLSQTFSYLLPLLLAAINYPCSRFLLPFPTTTTLSILLFNHALQLLNLPHSKKLALTLFFLFVLVLVHHSLLPALIIPSRQFISQYQADMYMLEKTLKERTFPNQPQNPSFSSSLLEKIYHSIEEGERETREMKFHRETMAKKHSRSIEKCNRTTAQEEEIAKANLRRACLIEKWMDKKVSEKVGTKKMQQPTQLDTKLHLDHDHDQDVLFFSSTSSSSDSSSGGFSSSDTESVYGVRSQASCFAPPRPKPVKTSVSVRSDRSEKKDRGQKVLSSKHRETRAYDVHEEGLIKSKSRALKMYENIKKAKQPISPGGRLTNFLNALFTPGNTRKSKSTSTCSVGGCEDVNAERKSKSGQASTCSSASSFSRSCLSKTSSSLRKDVKRTVRFYPVSVIVDEDSRPCGHKCLYKEEDTSLMPVSVPTAWKIGGSPSYKKNIDEEHKVPIMEKSRRVEEAAREFLKEYHQNQRKSDLILRDFPIRTNVVEEEDDEDDDAASYASSDLFELDHLAVMGDARYSEELPVYETTHVSTNRAIANGLIM